MAKLRFSRRDVLKGSMAAGVVYASPVRAQAPAPSAIAPELIAAARKEGRVALYTAVDLPVAERFAKAFQAKYRGITVRVERTGAERLFQRIGQEVKSGIHAVDVVNSSDAAHSITWKRAGLLAAYVPEDAARHFPADHRDPDGTYFSFRTTLSVIGYNSKLVKPEDAPKSLADLLDPKWLGRMVKSHPAYSGSTMTATFQIARDLGWDYFAKLAKQKIMQVQSGNDPPKKLQLGERAVMADGNEYTAIQLREEGHPVEVVYATEGTPFITGPSSVFKSAPNPNAARLMLSYMASLEAQQLIVDVGGLRSVHANIKEPAGRTPLSQVKLMKDDPAAVEAQSEDIKGRYAKLFGV